jgi:hypothetical protein
MFYVFEAPAATQAHRVPPYKGQARPGCSQLAGDSNESRTTGIKLRKRAVKKRLRRFKSRDAC